MMNGRGYPDRVSECGTRLRFFHAVVCVSREPVKREEEEGKDNGQKCQLDDAED
jgi:hypothetical protein